MALFAEASGSNPVAMIIVLVFVMFGIRNICRFLSGNKTARDATKQGGMFILRNLFKK
jgi:hypothetical protein